MPGRSTAKPVSSLRDEFALTMEDLNFFQKFASKHIGIHLAQYKRNMVLNRVLKRLRAHGMTSVTEYRKLLELPGNQEEVQHLINALTTNKTSFFRESHHFDHMINTAIPSLTATRWSRLHSKLRIWSAGCSTGEEAYSAAIMLQNSRLDLSAWDIKILGTDIDTNVVEIAREARYPAEAVADIPLALRHCILPANDENSSYFIVAPAIRSHVVCKSLNLFGPWPMRGPMHIIFCRNVLIYFNERSQAALLDRFADILVDNGFLYAGHSESIVRVSTRFRPMGQSVYQKIA